MKKILLLVSCSTLLFSSCNATEKASSSPINTTAVTNTAATPGYWQQHVEYTMTVDVDVETFQYKGQQKAVYTNNSPDVLHKVFYHLYFNAFQPGSEMDMRLQSIPDPDPRMVNNLGSKTSPIYESRISKLSPSEIGYIKINTLKQNGKAVKHETVGTILEVTLNTPIQPGASVTFDMDFDAQVPVQIRRSGRQNKEGVEFSMTQWYPKLAEYDFEGWHADPYIAREFHGVWGDFDVKITIDKEYVIGGTGYLQNPNQIGHGYETGTVNKPSGDKLTWHFKAPKVHDFTWAADPDFNHDTYTMKNGTKLHFLYQNTLEQEYLTGWKDLQPKTAEIIEYLSEHVGPYPYKQYSVIQGGDGGMEYAMCTLITGKRKFGSLFGVTAHEAAHTWFQFLMATNEAKHAWMDEGFTSYISTKASNDILKRGKEYPTLNSYRGYISLAKSGVEQPLTTHSDRYNYNRSYGTSAYGKGSVFLTQLGYIIGQDNLKKTLKKYYNDWSFKHPTPNDFIRVAEKISGIELDWYLTDFGRTVNTIDYAVNSVTGNEAILERIGLMPMPLDISVTFEDGSTQNFYIPLEIMRGEKSTDATQLKDWAWGIPTYSLKTDKPIASIIIDPKGLMADIDRGNNNK